MAFNCRIYGHRGIEQLLQTLPKQYTSDAVFQLVQPYEFAATLIADSVAVSSAAQPSTDKTMILRIEVPDGATIRYEINPPGRAVVAGTQSPSLSGKDNFYFRAGWTLSVIDASALP